jgi:transposase
MPPSSPPDASNPLLILRLCPSQEKVLSTTHLRSRTRKPLGGINLCPSALLSSLANPQELVVLARRWVVERSSAWISHNRRVSKNYASLRAVGEAFIQADMTRLMVRRLTCS